MPTEQQELSLKVTLDDEASPQLAQIRQALGALGGTGGGGGGTQQIISGLSEFDKALGNLARSALGVGRASVDLAKVIGPMPVAMGALAYQTLRASDATESWSAQMVRVANTARMAGTSVGDFRSVTDSVARGGMSAQTAATMMVKFNQAYGELTTMGSARREHLLNLAGPEFVGNMSRAIRLIGTMRTDVEKLAYVQSLAENGFRHEMEKTGDVAKAEYIRDQIYAGFGVPELAMIDQRIVAYDKQTQANMNAESAAIGQLHAAHTEEQQTRDRIWEIIRGSTAEWDIWLTKQVTWVEKYLLDLAEKQEQFKRENENRPGWWTQGAALWDAPKDLFNQPWNTKNLINNPFNPTVSDQPGVTPLHQSGDVQDAVKTTDEHTSQLKRLTTNIQKMLTDRKAIMLGPVTKYQYGGTASSPTLAMVGEAGPEAVTNRYGTRIYNQPTIGMLGSNGPASVVPLNSARTAGGPAMMRGGSNLSSPMPSARMGMASMAPSAIAGAPDTSLADQSIRIPRATQTASRSEQGPIGDPMGEIPVSGATAASGARALRSGLETVGRSALDIGTRAGSELWAEAVQGKMQPEHPGMKWVGGSPPSPMGGTSKAILFAGAKSAAKWTAGAAMQQPAVQEAGRGLLDRMMGNQLQVGTSGAIKIEHENPPPGTEIETDGKVFEGAEKTTTSMPMFDPGESAAWRHPSEHEKDRRREIERAPYQPIDPIGIRG